MSVIFRYLYVLHIKCTASTSIFVSLILANLGSTQSYKFYDNRPILNLYEAY